MAPPLKYVHVNQHVDARNKRDRRSDPCITVKQGKLNRYAAEVEVLDRRGLVALRVCYRPQEPLPEGARCWIEVLALCSVLRGGRVVDVLPAGDPTLRTRIVQRPGLGDYEVTAAREDRVCAITYRAGEAEAQEAARILCGVTAIHVSKSAIRTNGSAPAGVPILTVAHAGQVQAADEVEVLGPAGELLAKVTYRPHKPLPCGARCWVETTAELRLIGEVPSPGRSTKEGV